MSRVSTHLTIDLDFWSRGSDYPHERAHAAAFIRKVIALGLPIHVVVDHHKILPTIRRDKAEKVINIDTHDDVCNLGYSLSGGFLTDLTDGTWVSFMTDDISYEWRYPRFGGYNCDGNKGRNTWGDPEYVRQRPKFTKKEGLKGLKLSQVTSVSVALSPRYVELGAIEDALRMLGRSGLGYGTKAVNRALKFASRGRRDLFDRRALKCDGPDENWENTNVLSWTTKK